MEASWVAPRRSLFLRCARFLPLQWRELQVGNLPKVGLSVRCCLQFALFDSLDGLRRRNPFLRIHVVDGDLNSERVLLREKPRVLSTDSDFCTKPLSSMVEPQACCVADFCDRRRQVATCPVCLFFGSVLVMNGKQKLLRTLHAAIHIAPRSSFAAIEYILKMIVRSLAPVAWPARHRRARATFERNPEDRGKAFDGFTS